MYWGLFLPWMIQKLPFLPPEKLLLSAGDITIEKCLENAPYQ